MRGTVISSGKGFWFVVCANTDEALLLHHSQDANKQCLCEDDRVAFEKVQNPRQPSQSTAVSARFIGHVIAQQVSGGAL